MTRLPEDEPDPPDVSRWRPVVAMALFVAGALALVWAAPPTAILIAWPLLFVVPGWLLVSRAVPDLSPPGRLGAGIVASVFLASHMVNLVATFIGFGRPAIVVVVGILGIATLVLAEVPIPFLASPSHPTAAGLRRTLADDRPAWLLAALIGLLVLAILGASAWHLTPTGWVSGGWNWSDFLVHVSIGASIQDGNFPPQVPYFVGAPLSYHWFADFHGAILATIAGLDVIPVFIVSSAIMAGSLALVVWELARNLTRDRRVATIATLLVCLGGGMGWIRLILDVSGGKGDAWSLLAANPYDNTWAGGWPWFRIASVFGTGLLPHRATTFGLPGMVAVAVLVQASLGRRPAGMLLAGMIAALLAPFHFYALPATYAIVLLYVLAQREWRRPTVVRDAALFLCPAILAAPFILGAISLQSGRGAFRLVAGWSEARFQDGPVAVGFFYLTNLGLPMVLAVVGAVRRRLPSGSTAFLVGWLVLLFLVPNLVVVSAVEFDMNKYFQMMWIAVAILAAWAIRGWPRPVIAACLAFAMISPVLLGIWTLRSTSVALSVDQERAGRWIEANTPDRSIFVTDAYINSPVDLAGRLRVTGFGPYVANLGYDGQQREQDVHSVYCDGDVQARSIMARYGATYVLSSGGLLDCSGHEPTTFDQSPLFESVFRSGNVAIWRIRG